jgi:hypothetical protein
MIKITFYYTGITHKIVKFRENILRIAYEMNTHFRNFYANY